MKILEIKHIQVGALLLAARIELDSGLVLNEVKVFSKRGKFWCDPGSRQLIDKAGKPVVNHSNHRQYSRMVGFASRKLANKFCDQLLAQIRREHPEIFAEGEP